MIKKLAFLFSVLCMICFTGHSQFKLPKFYVAFHGIYGSPIDATLTKNYNYGLGADAEAGLGFGKTMVTASLGYINYAATDNTKGALSFFPIKANVRQYFLLGLFANAGLGIGLQSAPTPSSVAAIQFDNSSNLLYEAGIGFKLIGIEGMLNYGSWKNSTTNTWNSNWLFKLGYALKL